MPNGSWFLAVVACLLAVLPGCGEPGSGPSEPNPVATISLSPASASVEPGRVLRLSATLRDSRRLVVMGREIVWASSDSLVAMVDGGVVIGVREGFAVITAEVDGAIGRASITVQRPVAVVEITPQDPTVAVGRTVQLHATLRGPDGHPVEGPVVSWFSSNPRVAKVGVGKVRGVSAGLAEITAEVDGKRATTTVTVVPENRDPPSPATAP